MREVERKYEVPAGFAVTAGRFGRGMTLGEPVVHQLSATYYDTPDLRLARERVTLRKRTGGSDDGWHLKRPVAADERDELQLPPTRSSTVPARASAEVRALTRGQRLSPVLRLATTRTEWPVLDGDGTVVAHVTDDEVAAQTLGESPTVRQWREVEVELADGSGDRALLKALDKVLRKAGAAPAASASKLARGLGDRLPEPPPGPTEGTATAAAGAYLREQRDALVTFDPLVRRDEPDAVHKMRVATRRARATLKTFRPLWDAEESRRLRGELKWLADALGGVRDAEVLDARLSAALAEEPPELVLGPVAARLSERLRADTARHRRALIAALDGKRYAALLDDLDALLAAEPTDAGTGPAAPVLRKRVRKAVEEVDALIATASGTSRRDPLAPPLPGVLTPDEAVHEARKSAKRARYAAEAAVPVAGAPAAALAKAMEDVQELLGGHQDAVVTRALLREAALAAQAAGEPSFTYGRLHAKQELGATAVEGDLPAARAAYGTKKIKAWLN